MRGKSPGAEPLAPPHLNPLPAGERKRGTDDNSMLMYNRKPSGIGLRRVGAYVLAERNYEKT